MEVRAQVLHPPGIKNQHLQLTQAAGLGLGLLLCLSTGAEGSGGALGVSVDVSMCIGDASFLSAVLYFPVWRPLSCC